MSGDKETLSERISRLEADIAAMREAFETRSGRLESEIQSLRQQLRAEDQQPEPPVMAEVAQQSVAAVEASAQAESVQQKVALPAETESNDDNRDNPWSDTEDSWSKASSKAEPGFMRLLLSGLMQNVIGFLLNLLGLLKSPFQQLLYKLFDLYRHYQQQGKAPVFLMTLAGLVTLTFGFGYLLQYSFTTLFGDTLKAVSGFVLGGSVTALGVWMSMRKREFAEYAASIIALGIVFCFLTAYFVGPYYSLVSEPVGFALLALITAIAFALALIFETRVVAVVTLAGGVLMPFVIGDVHAAGLAFAGYLLLLSLANLYLSRKIRWPLLAQLTFALSLSVIEYIGISDAVYPVLALALLSIFFIAYSYFWLFDGAVLREALSKQDLAILVANVFYFLYAILQLSAPLWLLATLLLALAALFIGLVRLLRLLQSHVAPIAMLYIGLLIATAVFVLSPADVSSILWSIEGLAMLAIGFHYRHLMIRVEGYGIYLLAMASLLWQAVDAFLLLSPALFGWHWINLLAFGALSFAAYRIIDHYRDEATLAERRAGFIQNEIFSLWGAVALLLMLALQVSAENIFLLAAIPMLWSFYRVAQHKLRFAQLTGFVLMQALLVQILAGVDDSGSLLLSAQPVISWLAMGLWLAAAWGLYFLFQHFDISGRGARFAARLHHFAFRLPALLLALTGYNILQVSNFFADPLSFGYAWFDLWILGGLIALLYWLDSKTEKPPSGETRTRHGTLLLESASFVGALLFLYTVAIVAGMWMFNAAALSILALLFVGIRYQLPLTEKLAWGHFLLFGVMAFFAQQSVGNLHFSEQTLATQIGLVEVLLTAWALQFIYQKVASNPPGLVWAQRLRIVVYCLLPLLFLPRIWRLYPDYFATALWASFIINWLMHKRLKIEALRRELLILFIVAVVATLWIALSALSGGAKLPGLIAIVSGGVVLALFHLVEKTFAQRDLVESPYRAIQLSTIYFYAFAIASLSFAALTDLTLALWLPGLFLLAVMLLKKLRVVIRPTLSVGWILAWILLTAVPLLGFHPMQVMFRNSLPDSLLMLLWNVMAVAGLWLLTHHRAPVLQCLRQRFGGRMFLLWVFHAIALIAYSTVLQQLVGQWPVAQSIAMLIHGIIVLMLTLKPQYAGLLRLSIALFGLTAIKVLFYDMSGSGNLQKVIALMGIGSILMAAAFGYQKMRSRLEGGQ